MRALVVAVAITSCSSGAVNAAGEVFGVGTASCTHFSQARATVNEVAYMSWVQGWLSGINAARKLQGQSIIDLDAMSFNAMQDFVRSYCGSHPKATVLDAGLGLLGQITGH